MTLARLCCAAMSQDARQATRQQTLGIQAAGATARDLAEPKAHLRPSGAADARHYPTVPKRRTARPTADLA